MATATLAELIVMVGVGLRDNVTGITSQDSSDPMTVIDDSRKTQTDDIYSGSEIFFPDLPASMSGPNPNTIELSSGGTGTLTLRKPWGMSGAPANTRYVIMNLRGRGHPYEYRLGAIRQIVESLAEAGAVVEATLGAGLSNTYTFTIPATLDTVFDVMQRSQVGASRYGERHIRKARRPGGSGWSLQPGRRLLINDAAVTNNGYDLILVGRRWAPFVNDLSATFNAAQDDVVRQAQELLTTFSGSPNEQAGHNALMSERMRSSAEYWYANEERVY